MTVNFFVNNAVVSEDPNVARYIVCDTINKNNNEGPRTKPCGTPDMTGRVSDGTCSNRTYWESSVKKS